MYKLVDPKGTEWTPDQIEELSAHNAELEDCKKQIETQENHIHEDGAIIYNLNTAAKTIKRDCVCLQEINKRLNTSLVGERDIATQLKEEVDLLKARVWDAENINIKISELVDTTKPHYKGGMMERVAAIVGNIPVGTEIMKNGTAATLIDYGKKLDEYETTIKDLKTTIKTNNEVSHADMDRKNGWIEELRKERDDCKESVAEKSSLIDELENAANKEWSLIKRIDEEIARRGDRMLYERDAIVKRQKNTIEDLKATIETKSKVHHTDMDMKDGWIRKLRDIVKRQKNVMHADSITIIEQIHKIEDQCKMLADYEKAVQQLINSNKDDRSIVEDMTKTIKQQKTTIDEQKAVITVMSGGKTIANRDKRIKDLEYDLLICKGINTAHNIHTAGLKKALALHEESSKTLTKVVDIVNDDTISSIEAMCEISNVVMRAKQ